MYLREREYTVKVTPGIPANVAAAAAAAVDETETGGTPANRLRASHSPDFASVVWFGVPYSFTPMQRSIVAVLWSAWEQGTPDVAEKTLLAEADSESPNVRVLMKDSKAWRTMIQRSSLHGGPPGCLRLVGPDPDRPYTAA